MRPIPSGRIVYGDCKGEFGRMNVATGQEQEYWINPQQRYGKNPKDMMFRFVRQAPIEIDAHNPNIVYHGSQYVHKSIDGGVRWTKFSPDVTAHGPESEVTSGEPITRDMTGEEVYAALYSMRSSRLEPGVFWTGSNDGPVWVTRDGGRTWKNVTPPGLPPGGRVHTIEDSPHRRGSAYVSVYRMYFNDFKPYLYMTNDYGAHWTLLTDGTNGIPPDQPMHVVREDPEQEGLLYAGTLQGAYVSFDQGKHWQTLQQNLPATPVTDIKVHHGDLVASTMGRSFWIMDDVAPLRQLAASVTRPTRPRTTDTPNGPLVLSPSSRARPEPVEGERSLRTGPSKGEPPRPDVVRAWHETVGTVGAGLVPAQGATTRVPAAKRAVSSVGPTIKPFDGSNVFLFTPAPAYRMHYNAARGVDVPEYPPVGARIDYYLASPSGRVTLDIVDAAGTVVRSYTSESRGAAATGRGGGGRRGGALPSTLPVKAGMNRFMWDLRYPGGPAGGGDGEGSGFSGGGPMAAPGIYKARLTAGDVTKTESFTVKIDPRIAKDGITVADLAEQTKLALKVRDALADARQLAQRVRQALDAKRGDQAALQSLWDRLMTKTGPYEDQMFIDQMSNVGREIGGADQKVGASAHERFNQLVKEWAAITADADKAVQ